MSDKSNKYGYVGVDIPEQSFGNNKGIFNPAEINELVADNKWTTFGQLELIETKNVSASSNTIFTDIKENIYNVHFMTITNYRPSTNLVALGCRFFESGVEESASVYQYALAYVIATGGEEKYTAIDFIPAIASTSNATNHSGNGYVYFYNLGDNTKYSFSTYQNFAIRSSTQNIQAFGSGVLPQASTVDQIKLFVGSGTFSADLSLYGIRYS